MKSKLLFKLFLIDRYIISELITFFLFSVGLLSSLGVAIGTISDLAYKVTEYNLPIAVAILIFICKIPEYIAYALPISTLLTTLVIYGRKNRDRELIALRSFGINIYRIVAPALIFSLGITGITFVLNELVVPAANYQANSLQNPFISETQLNLQRRDIFYPEYAPVLIDGQPQRKLKKIYYAENFDGEKLRGITIIGWHKNQISQIITAESAQWNQAERVWNLSNGRIDRIAPDTTLAPVREFNSIQLPLSPTLFKIINKERSPDDMNIRQAREYVKIIEHSGQAKELTLFRVRIQQKIAFPFICLVFALIGSAIGSNSIQINKLKGFGLCVGLVFTYYLLGFMFGALGIVGIFTPIIAAWLPIFIYSGIGIKILVAVNS